MIAWLNIRISRVLQHTSCITNLPYLKKMMVCFSLVMFASGIFFPQTAQSITIKQEEELGKEFIVAVTHHLDIIDDTYISNYVKAIGNKIMTVIPPQPFEYSFYVVNENVYNAFAGPGGHVFINSGLFEVMEQEEELAGILSHEISHVICRHISQRIERSTVVSAAQLAGLLASILLGAGGSGSAASAVAIGSMAAGQSLMLSYTRENEMQADQIGLKYLNKAGYSGEGLLRMLTIIKSKDWFTENEIPTYLRTHPAPEDRIIYIGNWIDGFENDGTQYRKTSDEFKMAHTRLVGLYGDEKNALKKFEDAIKKNPDDYLAHLGYGLVLDRINDRKESIKHIKIALKKMPFDPYVLTDLGRIYALDGQFEEAINTLKGAAKINNNIHETFFYLGRAQMALEEYEKAAVSLQRLVDKWPEHPEGMKFLGTAYGRLGNLADGHYYLGIYYFKKGEIRNAGVQLEQASKHMEDPKKKEEITEILQKINKDLNKQRFDDAQKDLADNPVRFNENIYFSLSTDSGLQGMPPLTK
ncbi:MAG: M48 family metalloprotease [Desulfobacterales bacterium]|nr:M48 family metalloprotease [Desulfobacterales bacterium]